jgi:transcription initiation factor IIE alpha subunit
MEIRSTKQFLLVVAIVFAALMLVNAAAMKNASAAEGGVYYTCPMPEHADVVMDKPGKCPKCGMTLVAKQNDPVLKYTCPMHPDVVSDKPGKCPKCGMNLVPMKPEKK